MNSSNPLLIGCVWGMELAWLYAAASFIMTAAFGRPFPMVEAVAASLSAMLLTSLAARFFSRPFQFLGLHVIGFGVLCLHLIYLHQSSGFDFFNRLWLMEFLDQPKTLLQWLSIITAVCFLLTFWVDGYRIMARPKDFFLVRNRFDLGVGIFLSIFLIELLIIVKTGRHIQGWTTGLLTCPFFIFGLLAFSIVRDNGQGQRRFVMGYRGMGTVLSFAGAALLTGSGLMLLFLPQLTRSAEMGVDLIKTAARPLEPVVVSILVFLFGKRPNVFYAPETPQGSLAPGLPALVGREESLLWQVFGWGLIGVLAALALGLLLYILWRLVKWLFAAQYGIDATARSQSLFKDLARRLWIALFALAKRLAARIQGPRSGAQLYTMLVRWGFFSGLPLTTSETPLEYASRLARRFPGLKKEIQLIVDAHGEMVYGPGENRVKSLAAARIALRALHNPLHWPTRFQSLLLH